MNHYRAICAALFCALISVPAGATPFPSLSMDVGVCDPNNPANCVKPDASGNMPVTGTFSASLGGFTPSASGARGTPLSVTVADSSGTLPTGAVVAVTNVGTNPMYCNVNGIAATTSDQYISSSGGWFAFTIPAAITTLHCIATGSSTTANTVGGSGLPTGTGGGGGSGGGGAVTLASGAVASGAYSAGSYAAGAVVAGAFLDGWDATQGAKADAAWVSGSGSVIALLKNIATGVGSAIPAGTAIIGKVGIDQTTPGTTNGVQVNAALPAGTNLLGKTGIDQTTPGTTNGTQDASTGSTGATAPIKAIEAGGIAQNAEATAVTNGQLKGLVTDLVGKLITLPYSNPENSLNGQITTAMVATTSTAVTGMGAQGAGVRNYITACTFSNTHATVGTMINLQDGSGGTVLWQAPAGPAYAGAVTVFPNAIKTTANTGLFAVNATTGSSTLVSCTGYKGL
jgi:hypothetical protein